MGRHPRATAALVVALGALGASACASTDDGDSAGIDSAFDAPAASVDVGAPAGDDADDTAAAGSDESSDAIGGTDGAVGGLAAPGQLDASARALAIEAGVRIGTPDIRRAADDTLAALRRNGATVHTADVSIGTERDDGTVDGGGFFRVEVAPERLDALITDLDSSVGPVTGRTQNTADVTDQLVDLDIRISVERDVIEQFQALLRDATEFEDVVAIQRVISERTVSLEQLLAGQRNLENRVARSTLTIELFFTPTPIAVEPIADDDGITDAFATGWDAFVGALFAIGLVLAVSAPFVLTLLVVLGIVWLVGRGRIRHALGRGGHARPSTPPATTGGGTAGGDASLSSDEELAAPSRET